LSSELHNLLSTPGSVLLPGNSTWQDQAEAVVLHTPARIIHAHHPEQIEALLDEVQAATDAGDFVAGYLAYEAGAVFELATHEAEQGRPLAWFAVYPPSNVLTIPQSDLRSLISTPIPEASDFRLNVSAEQYQAAVLRVKELIAAGDTYQVNYTCRARFSLAVDPLSYFCSLVASHPVPYAAYINTGDEQILSLSPELFLKRRGDLIETRPMKGTRRRGRTPEEDDQLARELITSAKDRAENVMILDMMRNDLGRFSETGSIRVPEMFTAERYRSVWQMTSSVTGIAPQGVSLAKIMAATFPGSSITGAPKRRTMEIIRELETEPRGVYTGAICLFLPGGDFTCNIAIRTLVHREGRFELGIGSGIVWDSDPEDEYKETLLKSQFAFKPCPDLRLFETLLLVGTALRLQGRAYGTDSSLRRILGVPVRPLQLRTCA
jgi:para-aminobenzoate synthetase/4-amino-4-deoxychorismate lyase